jgi:flagellar protein FliL
MAAEIKPETEGEAAPEKGKSKKLILFAVIGLIVLGAAGGGAMFFLGGKKDVEADKKEEHAKPVKKEAIYHKLNQLTVGLQTPGRQRFLQVSITVMSRDQAAIEGVQNHIALIENRLNMLLGGEVFEELQTNEGRELLRQKVLAAIQEILQQEIGQPGVEQVYFENFVMQ